VALEQALRRFTIAPDQARVVLVNPGRGAALAGLAQAGGTTPDPERLAAAYCAIAGTAGADLPKLVRLAAAQKPPAGISAEDHNRVLLTAIAMRAVPEYREKLAGSARALVANCGASADPVTLAGREDLAKHWALSAAISATLGSQVARSMGTWKELADSSEGGSGFSFVDLAADRSGERFAMAAVKPQLARTVQARLVAITQDQMLPPELLTRPEGLDQAAFERDYTAVDPRDQLFLVCSALSAANGPLSSGVERPYSARAASAPGPSANGSISSARVCAIASPRSSVLPE